MTRSFDPDAYHDNAFAVGTAASGASDVGNPVKVGGRYNSTQPVLTDGQRGDLQIGSRGQLLVSLVDHNGATAIRGVSNTSDGVAADSSNTNLVVTTRPYQWNGTSWDRERKPSVVSRILSAGASTNGTVAKASSGNLHTVTGYNAAVSARFLKFLNKASAPSVGTDTPVLTLYLPPSSTFSFDFGALYFSAGIAFALTTGAADADTGALTAGDIVALNVTCS